jgi:hypothetical protein
MVVYLISPFCLLVGSLSNLRSVLIRYLEKQQIRQLLRALSACLPAPRAQAGNSAPNPISERTSDPFFSHIERAHLKWDQKNSLIETRSSGVRGVVWGKVSLANRIKSSGVF